MSALNDPRHDDGSVGHQAPAPCLAAPAAPAALATPAFFVLSEVCGSLPLVRMGRGRWKEGGCEREGGREEAGGEARRSSKRWTFRVLSNTVLRHLAVPPSWKTFLQLSALCEVSIFHGSHTED